MGPVGRLRRRWLSLGIDIRFMVFMSIGTIVGCALAWGEGIRNGKSPTVSIVCTVLLSGTLIYIWWAAYYELRGPGFARNRRPSEDRRDIDQTDLTNRPRS